MAKARVQEWGKRGYVVVNTEATAGATVGVDLRWQNGDLVSEAALRAALAAAVRPPGDDDFPETYWRLILEIPPNVIALAETTTTGLYTITGDGTSVTREIEVAAGELTVENGSGVAGNPALGLADVPDIGGGEIRKFDRDSKGRVTGTSAATTDDLSEGATNLYFTNERAQDAAGAVLDDSGDVELHYETSPARRIWATLSTAVQDALAAALSALQPGDNVSELVNDADYITVAVLGDPDTDLLTIYLNARDAP